MLCSDIPETLFSCIKEDDPYRESKVFEIERWSHVNWDLYEISGKERHYFLAQIFSSEECWKKVDNIHGIKLDTEIVGKRLIAVDSDNPFHSKRYNIACRWCLVQDISVLFPERDRLPCDSLTDFWSHLVSGRESNLNLKGLHLYEYALKCAMGLKQARAVEFFWNKIKSVPEVELSVQDKDEIFMKAAVRAAGNLCNTSPEIFEFCFSRLSPEKYPELLERDLAENFHYGSLNALQDALRFDQFKKLFDCLRPSDVKEFAYCLWLQFILTKIEKCCGRYLDSGAKLFMHMWMKESFDSHRAFALNEMIGKSFFQGSLVPFVSKGYMEPVWAVLDKANPAQIKEFMNSKQSNDIRSILKERGDQDSLHKFQSYGKSATIPSRLPAKRKRQAF